MLHPNFSAPFQLSKIYFLSLAPLVLLVYARGHFCKCLLESPSFLFYWGLQGFRQQFYKYIASSKHLLNQRMNGQWASEQWVLPARIWRYKVSTQTIRRQKTELKSQGRDEHDQCPLSRKVALNVNQGNLESCPLGILRLGLLKMDRLHQHLPWRLRQENVILCLELSDIFFSRSCDSLGFPFLYGFYV